MRMTFVLFRALIWCVVGMPLFVAPRTAELRMNESLERTGRLVELFWEQVPSFTCTESVTQAKIGKKGKVEYKEESVFDYLALTKVEDQDLSIEELRLPKTRKREKPGKPSLLDTNGFPSLLLIFHPLHQPNFRFQMEPEIGSGTSVMRIRFEHIPGTRSTTALMTRGRIHPLEFRGTAWIEKETGAIQKISAGLVSPMKEINIESFTVEVKYAPQDFPLEMKSRWLPLTAVIELKTARQHWRNNHVYSGYKRFSVESMETVSK